MQARPPVPDRRGRFAEQATLPVTLLVQAAASAAIVAPAVAAGALPVARAIGPAAVGIFIAVVYAMAMLSSQWAVPLVRRWGPIRTSQLALLACAGGLALVSLPSWPAALGGAMLLGLGYGPVTPASSEMLARTTPAHRFALVFSLKQTGVPLGGAVAGLLVPGVTVAAGPAWGLGQIGLLCLLGTLLAALLRAQVDRHREPDAPLPTLAGVLVPIRFVLADPLLRRIAFCTLALSGAQLSLGTYAVAFLHQDLRWSLVAAGLGLTVAQVAGMAGRIAWGMAADRLPDGARRMLRLLCIAAMACGVAVACLPAGAPRLLVLALLAAYGATAIGWNGVYLAMVARAVPRPQAALATGGSLFFTYLGVVLAPPLFGAVAGLTGSIGLSFGLLALPLAAGAWILRPPPPAVFQGRSP
jgi:MFS family permease